MDEHKKFLADRLLSEERPITYRLLSRALSVHVNTAKSMLYDFHKYQNAQRAGSVDATYLILGVKHAKSQQNDGDVGMSSSMPEPEPLSDAIPTWTLTLVGEGSLQEVLSEYQEVAAIHVYSLAPHKGSDRASLTDVAKSISEYPPRKTRPLPQRSRPAPSAATVPAVQKPIKPEPEAKAAPIKPSAPNSAPGPPSKLKKESSDFASKNPPTSSSSGKNPPSTSSKRGGPGGIMHSFAKAASKPPSKATPPPKKEDDTSMALSDDGEADDADIPAAKGPSAEAGVARRTRKEREEELRRMMEEDDEDDKNEHSDKSDEEMEDVVEPEPEMVPEAPAEEKPEEKEPAEVVSSTGDGRRRGKRRIMKKKRILDDQGYMVTIQEPGWESFSEDESPQPPAKKAATTPTSTPSSSGAKAKKPAGKAGQGNIMSFFSKK
ncbi:DNA polymerase subunit Cdc27 [Purpureocillium lavendulum]|uniref:DNA polymerase delta subunit 3 n=1 Tax=Purpureocillium lavendulum TaxID=1247861 RepID=A0AB34FUU7_9HYPO|nr:DNA polymerase subunit Cdc27 [Purpureocillium lavendulum]